MLGTLRNVLLNLKITIYKIRGNAIGSHLKGEQNS